MEAGLPSPSLAAGKMVPLTDCQRKRVGRFGVAASRQRCPSLWDRGVPWGCFAAPEAGLEAANWGHQGRERVQWQAPCWGGGTR